MSTAIVTGGAKGIGREIVKKLATKGMNVVINYKTSKEQAEELQKELKGQGYKVEIYKADISKREQAKELIEFVEKQFGNIDILVNNAGIDQFKLFIDITDEEWNNIIQTNLTSIFYTTQEAVKNMIKNKKGCIINISSIWGITGAACEVAYSVSKAGIDGLTKSLAKELGPSNIRVNSIAPGAIMTDMNKNLTQDEIKELNNQIPMGRFGTPEEIAKCVNWLIEDTYTTGQIISPNGGWLI